MMMNKFVLFTLLVAITSVVALRPAPVSDLDRPLRQDMKDYVNSVQKSWAAGDIPDKFKGLTLAQIKVRFFGAMTTSSVEDSINVSQYDYRDDSNDIPTNFNSSTQWPGCVQAIRDQGHCTSGWAFTASGVLSDRFCIASNKSINVVLSTQYMVSCDRDNYGCKGGAANLAWAFIATTGLPTENCYPYTSQNGTSGTCYDLCQDGSNWKTYRGINPATLLNPTSIQNDILAHGPVAATFIVYEDFVSYKGGIYKHTTGLPLGYQVVKIVGWGKDESTGTNYWIVHNSWGTGWGENGLFRIAFGQCGIDRAATSIQAKYSGATMPKIIPRWA